MDPSWLVWPWRRWLVTKLITQSREMLHTSHKEPLILFSIPGTGWGSLQAGPLPPVWCVMVGHPVQHNDDGSIQKLHAQTVSYSQWDSSLGHTMEIVSTVSVGKNSKIAKYDKIVILTSQANSSFSGSSTWKKTVITMIKFPTPTTYPLAEEGAEPGVSRNICLGPNPATIAHSWLSELQLRRGQSELGCQGGHTSCTSFEASPV